MQGEKKLLGPPINQNIFVVFNVNCNLSTLEVHPFLFCYQSIQFASGLWLFHLRVTKP